MLSKRMAVVALVLVGFAAPARALTFEFSEKDGDTLTTSQQEAFQIAAQAWANLLRNDVTLSVQIGFKSLGSTILGQTSSSFLTAPAATVAAALRQSASTPADTEAVTSVPSNLPESLVVSSAEAKALGLAAAVNVPSDGTIEFNSDYTFSDSRYGNGAIAAGTYDLVGIAEHEFGHLLGFDSSVDGGGDPTLLDMYRYSAPGQHSLLSGQDAYFSLDNGATSLASFSTGLTDQASHWLDGTYSDGSLALMNPNISVGAVQNITSLDWTAMDVIGWDASQPDVSPVPLPASAPMFGAALLALGAVGYGMKRRKSAAAA